MKVNQHLTWSVVAVAVSMSIDFGASTVHGDDITIENGSGKATVRVNGKLFTEYVYEGHAKPILYPIIGPHGIEMTRHYPMRESVDNEANDHPHQKSLWFTHGNVNGIDFWSEYGGAGRFGRIVQTSMAIQDGSIQSENEWIAPEDRVLCTDLREIRFTSIPQGRAIDFRITIHASHGDVTFGDTKEGTMGMRTNPLLRLRADKRRGNHTAVGRAVNSDGIEGAAIWGKRAAWVDYWAPIQDHVVGIAIFDHPSNPRHPTWWHARDYGLVAANPFGIHDFEGKEAGVGDMRINDGTSMTWRYQFLFHEGDTKSAHIEQQYASFAADGNKSP